MSESATMWVVTRQLSLVVYYCAYRQAMIQDGHFLRGRTCRTVYMGGGYEHDCRIDG